MRTPDVIFPECVVECVSCTSKMTCVSACEELVHGPTQTGDGYSEPNGPLVSISGTSPVSRDVAYGARFAFSERPSCARLRVGNPARKRSAWDSTRPRGRLKWRRVLSEFGKLGPHACAAITCCAPPLLFAECAERVPGTMRSCWPVWETAQVRCASDVIGTDLAARVGSRGESLESEHSVRLAG